MNQDTCILHLMRRFSKHDGLFKRYLLVIFLGFNNNDIYYMLNLNSMKVLKYTFRGIVCVVLYIVLPIVIDIFEFKDA